MLGDDALVMSHRLQEWCAHAPELEEEIALANIALDLLGQARLLLARAGGIDGTGRSEDDLAFFRAAGGVPQRRAGRGSRRRLRDLDRAAAGLHDLAAGAAGAPPSSADPVLAAIAAKGVKEVDLPPRLRRALGRPARRRHRRVAPRAQDALDAAWPLTGELFRTHEVEGRLASGGIGVDPASVREEFEDVLAAVAEAATLRLAGAVGRRAGPAGATARTPRRWRDLVAELQSVARAHPGATW